MSEQNSRPNGEFGKMIGDSLMGNLTALIPGARGYPVQYPGSVHMWEDNQEGKSDVINRLVKQTSAYPNQKFALAGFSQGAVVVRLAAAKMPVEIIPKILAVVVYGDPTIVGDSMAVGPVPAGRMSDALYKRLQENCSKGDFTCDTGPGCHSDLARHMDYEKQPWIIGAQDSSLLRSKVHQRLLRLVGLVL
jgi:cutinase